MTDERIPVAKEGAPFFGCAAFLALVAAILGSVFLTLLFLLAALFFIYFFRDPERSFTSQKGAVISPADGKIVALSTVKANEYGGEECFKLSIFMSPFNVHVNRAPVDCTVAGLTYTSGRYWAADKDVASRENERNALSLETDDGRKVVMVQVAGFLARRIVCRARPGDRLAQAERFGLIRMGSRVDLYLPPDFTPWVRMGERVRAGQTTLGILP